ncbi:MAG: glycerol-3-phosphate dehydrogenase [Cypionkella sp.]|uniref:NAD(P)H-dependent glycerol-3-phosphate dehydrogenase n=1 Tax=Cypionkella sp. TaxID=2811411 RepID=UPI002602456F|nr:NAD(P)H-dependent glycerol-3-phosphate dehydrogenase [Cypionkella sp.]MDB5658551.1 glycerol-3-phosphate dehydrogenase [Cypionkella sp.]
MIGIVGAGAFGTALAVALGREGREVRLWARDPDHIAEIARAGTNAARLPGVVLPKTVSVTAEISDLAGADAVLLSLPMQALRAFLSANPSLNGLPLVACCKGVDLVTLKGPTALIKATCPASTFAILTGPSFAADIARGLPTALTLACAEGEVLQHLLATPSLRLYRTSDVIGAELGGALKNVIAIATGIVMGAGLGDSARAALMTRGYAEMTRLAMALGGRAETLAGLSGFGDLVLTCTSTQSRNFRFGHALGAGKLFDPKATVEGAATAIAVTNMANTLQIEMPITSMISALISEQITLPQAISALLSRPLKQE